jgi:hypothetical protein
LDFSVGEGTGYASFTSQASFSLPRNTPASMEKIDKKDVEVRGRVSEFVKDQFR